MLIGNYSVFNKCPGKFRAGTSTCDRSAYNLPGMSRGFYFADGGVIPTAAAVLVSTHPLFTYGIPVGANPPYSWIIPQVAGGMAMRSLGIATVAQTLIPQQPTSIAFTGSGSMLSVVQGLGNIISALTGSSGFTASITADGNLALNFTGGSTLALNISGNGNIIASLAGAGELSAGASLFLNALCAMTGSGTMAADASLLVSMLCAMTGDSIMTASITGQKSMSASMTGTGTLEGNITAFGNMITDLLGSGILSSSVAAIAEMELDIVVTGTGLSTANVGQAVFAALASLNNVPGTMGEKLNNAGANANPWTELIEGSYTAADILRLLSAVAAGKTTIIDLGGGQATVTFRDINDTVDRVIATMDDSERTNVDLNL